MSLIAKPHQIGFCADVLDTMILYCRVAQGFDIFVFCNVVSHFLSVLNTCKLCESVGTSDCLQ